MSRVNDSLPQETGAVRWRWEKAGWLLVDRMSGRVQQITLPEFDLSSSEVSWFRDYAAYCGTSDDGQKAFTVIVQLGRAKAAVKETLAGGGPRRMRSPRLAARSRPSDVLDQGRLEAHLQRQQPIC
jgi:hypothetical protein